MIVSRNKKLCLILREAVRIAGELNLHRCITKMPHTKKRCYERTRLHFVVYICDHLCSLSRGRPPLTRETKTLKSPRALLGSDFSSPSDLHLVSQVEIWSISTQIFDSFGAATDSALLRSKLTDLEHFSETYETWRHKWTETLIGNPAVEQVVQTVLTLSFHSARLQLFSHMFRGPNQDLSEPRYPSKTIDRIASASVNSALSIVQIMVEVTETGASANLPSYFYTTLAFASVFLLKGPWHLLNNEALKERALQMLDRLIGLGLGLSTVHPLSRIINGLRKARDGQAHDETSQGGQEADNPNDQDARPVTMSDDFDDWDNSLAPLMFPHDIDLEILDFDTFDFSHIG